MKSLLKTWLRATAGIITYPFTLILYWVAYAIGYMIGFWKEIIERRHVDCSYEKFGETYDI